VKNRMQGVPMIAGIPQHLEPERSERRGLTRTRTLTHADSIHGKAVSSNHGEGTDGIPRMFPSGWFVPRGKSPWS
jgi:hypothetical protein